MAAWMNEKCSFHIAEKVGSAKSPRMFGVKGWPMETAKSFFQNNKSRVRAGKEERETFSALV